VILIASAAIFAWDQYMKATWDDHIITEAPSKFTVQKEPGKSWKSLSQDEIKRLPDVYKKPLEIVQDGDQYIWKSNKNEILHKTIENTITGKNGEKVETANNWVYLRNSDSSEEVRIQANLYIQRSESGGAYGCFPWSWSGNVVVKREMSDGRLLAYSTNTDVYENILQFFMCK
jgi:hypothetical protein